MKINNQRVLNKHIKYTKFKLSRIPQKNFRRLPSQIQTYDMNNGRVTDGTERGILTHNFKELHRFQKSNKVFYS